MKTIGVLGGMGPQATDDFVVRLHRAANRVIQPRFNTGYPPMVVHYHRKPPVVLLEGGAPKLPMEADGAFLDAAAWLGSRADFLVMTANAPHLFEPEIRSAAGKPLLSMIGATLAEVARRGWRHIGVMGFGDPRVPVYTGRMAGLRVETVDEGVQRRLNPAVMRCQEGRATEEDRTAVAEAAGSLRARGVDGIIPGCTEFPLILGELAEDMVNPLQLLAEAAVMEAVA